MLHLLCQERQRVAFIDQAQVRAWVHGHPAVQQGSAPTPERTQDRQSLKSPFNPAAGQGKGLCSTPPVKVRHQRTDVPRRVLLGILHKGHTIF